MTTGNGDDTVQGNGGNDILAGGKGNDTIHGGDGDDTLYNKLPNVTDNAATVDHLFGDAGNDTLHSFRASGTIDGGADTDKVVIDRRGPAINLTLDISDSSVLQVMGDTTVQHIEQVEIIGGDGNDNFTGGALADYARWRYERRRHADRQWRQRHSYWRSRD